MCINNYVGFANPVFASMVEAQDAMLYPLRAITAHECRINSSEEEMNE